MRSKSPSLSVVTALMLVSAVSGCGGSGYSTPGNATPAPSSNAPAPSPSPAPTPAPTPSTAFADCYGNTALYTAGNTYQVDVAAYKNIGTLRTFSTRYGAIGAKTFKDLPVVHTHIESLESGSVLVTSTEDYTSMDSQAKSIHGAVISTFLQGLGNPSLTVSYSPAIRYPFNLAAGASFTQTYVTTQESSEPTLPAPGPISQTMTITFVGNENVIVPAGTFVGCKTEISTVTDGVTAASTEWIVASGPYRGLFLQSRDRTTLTQATRFVFNGVASPAPTP